MGRRFEMGVVAWLGIGIGKFVRGRWWRWVVRVWVEGNGGGSSCSVLIR